MSRQLTIWNDLVINIIYKWEDIPEWWVKATFPTKKDLLDALRQEWVSEDELNAAERNIETICIRN